MPAEGSSSLGSELLAVSSESNKIIASPGSRGSGVGLLDINNLGFSSTLHRGGLELLGWRVEPGGSSLSFDPALLQVTIKCSASTASEPQCFDPRSDDSPSTPMREILIFQLPSLGK